MENETLRSYSAAVGVDVLGFFNWRERYKGERLGFAALENGRSVRAWQHAHFTRNRSQVLITAAVDSLFLVQNADAKRFLLDVIECLRDRERISLGMFFQDRHLHFFAQRFDCFGAGDFARCVKRAFDSVAGHLVGNFE